MPSNPSIRSLERGLLVLRTLSKEGPLNISQTATKTSLPRQTVSRIVHFLHGLGYVVRRKADKRFEISETTLELTDGLNHTSWIRKTAVPAMEKLCREVLWPVALTQARRLRMEIMWNTESISPLVMRSAPVGLAFPIATTVAGQVFLANCEEEQRQTMINAIMKEEPNALKKIDLSKGLLNKKLNDIKTQGFYCDKVPHKGHAALAAPILIDGVINAVIDIRFPLKALGLKDATNRYSDKIMNVAYKITKTSLSITA